jgi:DNA-binding XRE family transcriptional regulator
MTTSDRPDRRTCPECGRTFDTFQGLRVHQGETDHDRGRNERLNTESYFERYRRIREEIPNRYRDAYDDATGSGQSPRAFQAGVAYIESEATMETVADAFDTSEVTIRNHVNRLVDRGVVTIAEVRENNRQDGTQKFGEVRGQDGRVEGSYDHTDISQIRATAGLTRAEFATRLNVLGQTVRDWENPDAYNPAPPMVDRINDTFNI